MQKKYKKSIEGVDLMKKYSITEATEMMKKLSYSKFDGTVEIAIKTYANPKYNDQMMRGTTIMPHGTGKTVRVAAFVGDDMVAEAKKAGADIAGNAELVKKIESGDIQFDILVTSPDMMRDLAKVAKTLGPKGLMPSPKSGTVSPDIAKTIEEFKKGKVEFKLDKTGNIHVPVGKVSFAPKALEENISTLLKSIEDHKPTGIKGKLIKKAVIAPTMGAGVMIDC